MFEVNPIAIELGKVFENAGYELALVGGAVRDLLLKRPDVDLDFTTNARPDDIEKILSKYCDDMWSVGKKFGTIGGKKDGMQVEVTTYRTDEYDSNSRKPLVKFGDTLEADLSRRDFTVNSIALRLPSLELVDPFGGISDMGAKILKTPIDPELSFSDDPLRMMRAVRFVSTLGFDIEPETAGAILNERNRMQIVSKERIRDEFTKLILSDNPRPGIEALVDSGLVDYVFPELADLQMAIDPAHHHKDVYEHSIKVLENAIAYEGKKEFDDIKSPDLELRLAALLHDIGKPQTRRLLSGGKVTFQMHDLVGARIAKKRLRVLHYSNDVISNVTKLIELHMRFYGYGDQEWTDSAVRRYVHDAGNMLSRLHILTRSDVTTQNTKKMQRILFAYDDIMQRIDKLKEKEEFEKIRPELNGYEIMQILDLKPGPEDGPKIGKAYDFLLNYRLENGPIGKEKTKQILLDNFTR
ncbi:MAG: CCA tRNA nucleotidyltransferase [Candidatus Ancillula sp.]|jgi:poly(A) polymerase|nr:CCA tRNA nucleotidyltransferase [Candidatus Ancillula sp.]